MKETAGMGRNCELSAGRGALLAGMALAATLAACAEIGQPEPQTGHAVGHGVETRVERQARITYKEPGGNPSFGGFAIADEPAAAQVAQQMLDQGGNAADAAAALYFALSVTWPAAAGLGGGGICLVRDAGERKVESIAFLSRSPRGGGAVAIPGNVRGFALLQSRYGNQPWSAVVGPAERLAGAGFPLSRAAARRLADAAPGMPAAFTGADGAPLRELERVTQADLAATLMQIRSRGVTGFYAGETARALVAGAREAGGTLSLDDLGDDRPVTAPAQMLPSSAGAVAAPSETLGAGVFAAALWRDIEKAGPAELAEAARRTAAALGAGNSARDYGSTAFATADGRGGAIACAVTMSGPFGTGRVAAGTGVVLAPNPQQSSASGLASAFLMPVIVTSSSGTQIFFSGAGAGEPKGAASILSAARSALADTVADVLAASPADARSPAHAISCPNGNVTGACSLAVGPRGDGMGVVSDRSGS